MKQYSGYLLVTELTQKNWEYLQVVKLTASIFYTLDPMTEFCQKSNLEMLDAYM